MPLSEGDFREAQIIFDMQILMSEENFPKEKQDRWINAISKNMTLGSLWSEHSRDLAFSEIKNPTGLKELDWEQIYFERDNPIRALLIPKEYRPSRDKNEETNI